MTTLQKFQAALAETDADAALISSELHQRYLSDFDYTDGYLLITPTLAYLLTDFRYIEAAEAQVKNFTILRPAGTMIEEIERLISKHVLRRIAIEDASLSYADFTRFSKALSQATLCPGASRILEGLRIIKTPEELEKIARAQEIADQAFDHILGFLSPERTEQEVALELEFFMRKLGAENVSFQTIAVSGPASSLPHGVPAPVRLRPGFLTMDYGALYQGYCSDMTRTVVIGKADEDMKKLYNTVLDAQLAALETLEEGKVCRDVDEVARSIIRNAGYGDCFGHGLGHGVGMRIHEAPRLSPAAPKESVLKRGHVVTVEPGIYLAGKYGCRIEDMVAIDHDGSIRNFARSPKNLIEI
ncbi:MAG: aminopeptidase P family protein [Clostridia bacterium]|nr:aminopeptidase P family protein [Clostridia bacterium]